MLTARRCWTFRCVTVSLCYTNSEPQHMPHSPTIHQLLQCCVCVFVLCHVACAACAGAQHAAAAGLSGFQGSWCCESLPAATAQPHNSYSSSSSACCSSVVWAYSEFCRVEPFSNLCWGPGLTCGAAADVVCPSCKPPLQQQQQKDATALRTTASRQCCVGSMSLR